LRLIDIHPEHERQVQFLIRGAVVCCTLCVLAWAVWPQSSAMGLAVHTVSDNASQISSLNTQAPKEIRQSEFDATLWYAPKPVVQATSVPTPTTKVQLELLAISSTISQTDDGSMACLVYDPADDVVRTMRLGDEVHGYRVSIIDQTGMTLIGDRKARIRLDLDDGGAG